MLCADCFVAMGAAAVKTSRIRLGTGVLIPSNRIAPVTAGAFASLNKLAPGRIDFGVGTGFTGRRAMGLGAMRLQDMEIYIRTVYALLRGETVEAEFEGRRRKIRFLNPELGLINTRDPITLHISAYGPRAQALAARLKAGWLYFIADLKGGIGALEQMRAAWTTAGHTAPLSAVAFALGCVLTEGEPYDSPRALAQAGPRAAVLLHRAADEVLTGLPNTSKISAGVAETVAGYVELARTFEPTDARYLLNHRGHLLFVKPEERRFVTADLIRETTFTATEAALTDRIAALRAAGTPNSPCSSSRARRRRSRIGAASCGRSADGAVRCHVVRPSGLTLVPVWFQPTRMYDKVRRGAFKTRSRFDGRMRAGTGRCADAVEDS